MFSSVVRHKSTHIENRLNKMAVWILILQALICIVLAIFDSIYTVTNNELYKKIFIKSKGTTQ
jgi:hypothetical protein